MDDQQNNTSADSSFESVRQTRAGRIFWAFTTYRKTVLLVSLCITALAAYFLPTLTRDTRAEAFIRADHPAVVYRDKVKEIFGLADPIIIAVVNDGPQGVFNPQTLELVTWLTEEAMNLPGVDPDRDDDQWLYLPAARKVRRISAADRGDYFLGTDFSYEDIKLESRISEVDYNHTTLREEEVDGHRCYVIESIPVEDKTAKELGYGKVQNWIDAEIWMSRKIVAKNHKTGHTSHFKFTEVDYEAEVNDDIFTERALVRGR